MSTQVSEKQLLLQIQPLIENQEAIGALKEIGRFIVDRMYFGSHAGCPRLHL